MKDLKKDLETANKAIVDKLEALKENALTTKDEVKLQAELAKEEIHYEMDELKDKADAAKDNLINKTEKEIRKLNEEYGSAGDKPAFLFI